MREKVSGLKSLAQIPSGLGRKDLYDLRCDMAIADIKTVDVKFRIELQIQEREHRGLSADQVEPAPAPSWNILRKFLNKWFFPPSSGRKIPESPMRGLGSAPANRAESRQYAVRQIPRAYDMAAVTRPGRSTEGAAGVQESGVRSRRYPKQIHFTRNYLHFRRLFSVVPNEEALKKRASG